MFLFAGFVDRLFMLTCHEYLKDQKANRFMGILLWVQDMALGALTRDAWWESNSALSPFWPDVTSRETLGRPTHAQRVPEVR